MAEGEAVKSLITTTLTPVLTVALTTDHDSSSMFNGSSNALQIPTHTTSPPPRRKYATFGRCSSCDNLSDIGSYHRNCTTLHPSFVSGQMRHSASQPNGFYDCQETQQFTMQHDKKSKLRVASKKRDNPLHRPKNLEALVKLIEQDDMDLNVPNEEGDSPIHSIIRHKRKKRADLLLTLLVNGCSRIDVNRSSKLSKDTALHLAVMEEEELLVKTLLTFGADVNPLNEFSQTPLDIAIDKQCCTITAILVSVGGVTSDKVVEGGEETANMLEPFDPPSNDDNVLTSSSASEKSDTPSVSREMVLSGGAWRELLLKDLEEGKATSTLYEKLNECINSNLNYSSLSGSFSANVDEAMALTQQQRELLRYRKTQRVQSSIIRPMAGSRVLCLDGGSVRGLIQIEVLRQLELKTGVKVTEIFDWIVGTSTGGILALGLVYAKKSLSQLRQLYFKLKDRVFSEGRLGFAYNTASLEKILKEEFGTDALLSDVQHPKVLITAVYKKTTQPELHFFNNCFDDDFSKQPVWKVARYTSAAPLIFSEMDHYVDGAVLANNPCEYALTAINNFYRGSHSTKNRKNGSIALVVSIGTGIFPTEELGNIDAQNFLFFGKHWFKSRAGGPFQRVENLITLLTKALMESEAVAENCQSRLQQQGIPFFRFNPHLDEAIPATEISGEKLLNMIMQARYQTMGVLMDRLVETLHGIRAIMKRHKH